MLENLGKQQILKSGLTIPGCFLWPNMNNLGVQWSIFTNFFKEPPKYSKMYLLVVCSYSVFAFQVLKAFPVTNAFQYFYSL